MFMTGVLCTVCGAQVYLFMLPDRMIRGILFLSCLSGFFFVCLFVCLSVVNFNLCYNFWIEKRWRLHI